MDNDKPNPPIITSITPGSSAPEHTSTRDVATLEAEPIAARGGDNDDGEETAYEYATTTASSSSCRTDMPFRPTTSSSFSSSFFDTTGLSTGGSMISARDYDSYLVSPVGGSPTRSASYGINGSGAEGDEDGDEDEDKDEDEDEEDAIEDEYGEEGGFQRSGRNSPGSVPSSVQAYAWEGGLRYHAFREGRYAFPNDETEQRLEDEKHAMIVLLCRGAHFLAPVDEAVERGGKVLDLGTGTGIWIIELGDRYPNAIFTGIDLSPIQPNYVPENVHFFVDDFEEQWIEPEDYYDFIHIRNTLHSVQDRVGLFEKAYRHLKPGGWLEIQEFYFVPRCDDDTLTPEMPYAVRDFLKYLEAGLRALGSELNAIAHAPAELRTAGFTTTTTTTTTTTDAGETTDMQHTDNSIHVTPLKCPIGDWPRDARLQACGASMRDSSIEGLRGLAQRPFINGLGWSALQVEIFLVEVRKALNDGRTHAYFPFYVVCAQRPLGTAVEGGSEGTGEERR